MTKHNIKSIAHIQRRKLVLLKGLTELKKQNV